MNSNGSRLYALRFVDHTYTFALVRVRLKLHLWQIDVRLFIQIDKRQSTRIRKKREKNNAENSLHLF